MRISTVRRSRDGSITLEVSVSLNGATFNFVRGRKGRPIHVSTEGPPSFLGTPLCKRFQKRALRRARAIFKEVRPSNRPIIQLGLGLTT
ncbi:MAG: hypothetical protein COV31_00295 [Candidatus Yanofskybacteria bacterium CG10_big_fil_rev_8_21_14_0_10_46_23]|uniref:Uncharacterized protein n=1 Tax=Candidatus Yanofskybacteria bacterium CG10_big_fil_rev_8_21_14_0_10_46_23 TaxID=1975098 RepID=A0A2H0R6T0_9BACT|nr:MAG: hypothetical protein COV31_00295 [Candidatus Yanofskybacteria bacterium CG10_big_fil_rev_8_21_14_0_10_46_23]